MGDGTNTVIFNFDRNNTTYNFKDVKSATTTAITLDSGTTGAVNIGTSNNAKTITIGNWLASQSIRLYSANTALPFSVGADSVTSGIGLYLSTSAVTSGAGLWVNGTDSGALLTGNVIQAELNYSFNSYTGGTSSGFL